VSTATSLIFGIKQADAARAVATGGVVPEPGGAGVQRGPRVGLKSVRRESATRARISAHELTDYQCARCHPVPGAGVRMGLELGSVPLRAYRRHR
jgi:hypothetical protein